MEVSMNMSKPLKSGDSVSKPITVPPRPPSNVRSIEKPTTTPPSKK